MKYAGNKFRENSFFFLTIPLIIGIVIGSFYGTGEGVNSSLVHQYFMPLYSGNTVLEVFKNTMVSSALFVTLAFLFGTSAVGQPFGLALLLYRGFGIGISSAMMYSLDGFKALPIVVTMILPKALAISVVSVMAVRELFRSSDLLFAYWKGDSEENDRKNFKLYWIKFIVLIIISLIISIADSVVNYVFSGLL